MNAQNVAFGVVALGMAVSAIGVVTVPNVVHAALLLVIVLAGVAAQYILMASEFLAWVQVLIYIGAIIVLFLFGIMLTRNPMSDDSGLSNPLGQRLPAMGVALLILGLLVTLFAKAFGRIELGVMSKTSTSQIGDSIFHNYVIPFEVVSMLLLAALVGAVVIARKD